MRGGTKSTLVKPLLQTANVEIIQSIPEKSPSDSQHVVDAMLLVNNIKITSKMVKFEDFSTEFCKAVYTTHSDRVDVCGDRYDIPSPKDETRSIRAKATKKKNPKTSKQRKIIRKQVEKIITPELDFPASEKDFKMFLTLKENKTSLQKLLGESLLKQPPTNKVVILSGLFEDPQEVRSNALPESLLRPLECDHEEADTRIVFNVIRSPTTRSVVECSDTDVLVILLSNYMHMSSKEVYM